MLHFYGMTVPSFRCHRLRILNCACLCVCVHVCVCLLDCGMCVCMTACMDVSVTVCVCVYIQHGDNLTEVAINTVILMLIHKLYYKARML